MSKFKVGDRVRCTGTSGMQKNAMDKSEFVSEIFTIKSINPNNITNYSATPYGVGRWCIFFEDELELITDRHELHITSDGTTTNAVYKLNGKVTKTAKAVCCPSDTFNFNTGAELAINRVLYGIDYNPKDVAVTKPTQPAKQEDKPKFEVGQKVKIVADTCNHDLEVGAVVTLKSVLTSGAMLCNRPAWWINGENCYISERDIEPYTEPEQPKEPIVLYCIKDYYGWLIKSKTYEIGADGVFRAEGDKVLKSFKSACDFLDSIHSLSACLIKTEKRQAKKGEYILITKSRDTRVKAGDVYKFVDSGSFDEGTFVEHPEGKRDKDGAADISPSEYLVLPDYIPEKVEPTYYSGIVLCESSCAGWWTVNKKYAVIDGVIIADDGDRYDGFESVKALNAQLVAKFIEYLGEQSC